MTWSLVTYLRNGTAGVAVLRDDGTLVGADRAQAVGHACWS